MFPLRHPHFYVVGLCFHLWFRLASLLLPLGIFSSKIWKPGFWLLPPLTGSSSPPPPSPGLVSIHGLWAQGCQYQLVLDGLGKSSHSTCFSLQRSKTRQTGPEVPSLLLTDYFVCVPTQQAFRRHTRKAICHSVNYFVYSPLLKVFPSQFL